MKRETLETYLGKNVTINVLGTAYTGHLQRTRNEKFKDDPNLYLPQNCYFLTKEKDGTDTATPLFRASHVKGIRNAYPMHITHISESMTPMGKEMKTVTIEIGPRMEIRVMGIQMDSTECNIGIMVNGDGTTVWENGHTCASYWYDTKTAIQIAETVCTKK